MAFKQDNLWKTKVEEDERRQMLSRGHNNSERRYDSDDLCFFWGAAIKNDGQKCNNIIKIMIYLGLKCGWDVSPSR